MQVSDSSSRILGNLLEARTGQQLTMSRRWRIESALAALLRERGIATLDELITILVMGREPSLSNQVVEALLNNETYFFRDRSPFDLLTSHALLKLAQRRADSRRIGQVLSSARQLGSVSAVGGHPGLTDRWAQVNAGRRCD